MLVVVGSLTPTHTHTHTHTHRHAHTKHTRLRMACSQSSMRQHICLSTPHTHTHRQTDAPTRQTRHIHNKRTRERALLAFLLCVWCCPARSNKKVSVCVCACASLQNTHTSGGERRGDEREGEGRGGAGRGAQPPLTNKQPNSQVAKQPGRQADRKSASGLAGANENAAHTKPASQPPTHTWKNVTHRSSHAFHSSTHRLGTHST
mmetsp:Transcript_10836/g.31416  ORF Transcript_10836/g.31416 Transcript_10836/m.31416 type:complete len:205 (+) Transcript_10836:1289-1903(+)